MSFIPYATFEVNLAALAGNYRLLASRFTGKDCAAVVKANAYGLGVDMVSKALWQEGCRIFFVANLTEAVELRQSLPEAAIGVFEGLLEGQEADYLHYGLTPVLNTPAQVKRFLNARKEHAHWTAIVHVDTGMNRLGLSEQELRTLQAGSGALDATSCPLMMSHLSCADSPAHAKNQEQLERFRLAMSLVPNIQGSLANSAGIFLGEAFHFHAARPGCALYGINPTEGTNPMQHVATLSAPLLQIRTLDRNDTVGYDASFTASAGSRIAIAGIGYSDGVFRSLSNRGFAYVAGHKAPFAGRVSMDMIALDVSHIPEAQLDESVRAEFINPLHDVNALADMCDTIGYEVFTRIGRRVKRVYV